MFVLYVHDVLSSDIRELCQVQTCDTGPIPYLHALKTSKFLCVQVEAVLNQSQYDLNDFIASPAL